MRAVTANTYRVLAVCLVIAVLGVLHVWSRPRVLCEWVKIYPDGRQLTGTMVEAEEGRGFEGEPDESPGLVISNWSQDIGLHYRDASGRSLNILFGGDFKHHYKLTVTHVTPGRIWSAQTFESFLTITEQVGDGRTQLSYSKATNLVEKRVYRDRSETPWDGVAFRLDPGGTFAVTRYLGGQAVAAASNLSIEEANVWRDQWSTPADRDPAAFIQETVQGWQREMARDLHLPALENEGYASLKARFF